MTNVYLVYHQHLAKRSDQIYGRLLLINNGSLIDTYIATSGLSNNQNDFITRGSNPIPPSNRISQKYRLVTIPVSLPNVKGVEGNFYPILPFTITLPDGNTRADFGIHFDANVVGSSGCIVIKNKSAWNSFEDSMKTIGQTEIPLIVSYS